MNVFFKERWITLKKIHQLSLKEGQHTHYLYGFLYQTLGILNLLGERCSEERFEEYDLTHYLDKNSKILDVGVNYGFMASSDLISIGLQGCSNRY
jgi:hypothetical protein